MYKAIQQIETVAVELVLLPVLVLVPVVVNVAVADVELPVPVCVVTVVLDKVVEDVPVAVAELVLVHVPVVEELALDVLDLVCVVELLLSSLERSWYSCRVWALHQIWLPNVSGMGRQTEFNMVDSC